MRDYRSIIEGKSFYPILKTNMASILKPSMLALSGHLLAMLIPLNYLQNPSLIKMRTSIA